MTSNALTALATVLLVGVGVVQVYVLLAQHRQHRLELAESYWRRWADCQQQWAKVVFIGREKGEYYQIGDRNFTRELTRQVDSVSLYRPSVWALQAVSSVTGLLSDVCLQVLSGQLDVADAYAVFGTAFLRQTQPLRRLLDPSSVRNDEYAPDSKRRRLHKDLQGEVQGWLMYHEGVRRRCLILIDLLWAEAARLEDLPPSDVRRAAEAKRRTGGMNRRRLVHECLRLRGLSGGLRARVLARFLKHAEFRSWYGFVGLRARRLDSLEESWLDRVLAADDADDSPNEVSSASSGRRKV